MLSERCKYAAKVYSQAEVAEAFKGDSRILMSDVLDCYSNDESKTWEELRDTLRKENGNVALSGILRTLHEHDNGANPVGQ